MMKFITRGFINDMLCRKIIFIRFFWYIFISSLSITHQNYCEDLLLDNKKTIETLILFMKQNHIKNMENLEDFLLV